MSTQNLVAQFESPEALLQAVRRARAAGYRRIEAYTPFAVEGLADALGMRETRLPWLILAGGLLGGAAAFAMQYVVAVLDYPLNVGGRPLNSWPAFMLVTFEFTVLGAALVSFFGLLALNRLPEPYHPIFAVHGFEGASQDRFFLCIEAADPQFRPDSVRRFLAELGPSSIQEIAGDAC